MCVQYCRKNQGTAVVTVLLLCLLLLFGCGKGSSEKSVRMSNKESGSSSLLSDSVTLNWSAPKSNADGTSLTDLKGYIVYYGPSHNIHAHSVDVGDLPGSSFSGLSSGTWCFTVTAYDVAGNESNYSAVECTTI